MSEIRIVGYEARHKVAFKRLNEDWINEYFSLEEADREVLDDPHSHIIDKGGAILFAMEGDVVAGTCALIKMSHGKFDFELAKMAVAPGFRGKGIGFQLGVAAIENAVGLGANNVFLQTNSILVPAIRLYRKLGFVDIPSEPTPYTRSDTQMLLEL